MDFEKELIREFEKDEFWIVIMFKMLYGFGMMMEKLVEVVEKVGWRIIFKVNWWMVDIFYGFVRIDMRKGDREKIFFGKWIFGDECRLIKFESFDFERGKDEFFRMVDSIILMFIYDLVIRIMRE